MAIRGKLHYYTFWSYRSTWKPPSLRKRSKCRHFKFFNFFGDLENAKLNSKFEGIVSRNEICLKSFLPPVYRAGKWRCEKKAKIILRVVLCSFRWDFEKQHRFSPLKNCCRQVDQRTFFLKKKRINKRKKWSFGLINEIFSLRVYPWLPCAKNPQSKILCKSCSISLMQTKHEHRTALHCDLKFNHTSISSGIQILTRYLSVFWKLRCFEAKKRKRYALWIGALFCLFPKQNGSFRSS